MKQIITGIILILIFGSMSILGIMGAAKTLRNALNNTPIDPEKLSNSDGIKILCMVTLPPSFILFLLGIYFACGLKY